MRESVVSRIALLLSALLFPTVVAWRPIDSNARRRAWAKNPLRADAAERPHWFRNVDAPMRNPLVRIKTRYRNMRDTQRNSSVRPSSSSTTEPIKRRITTTEDLKSYFEDESKQFRDSKGNIKYDDLVKALVVEGDTQIIGSPQHPELVHPVLKLLHRRKREKSKCTEGSRPDGKKVALVVEGGGMRGCLSAGMVAAIYYLGLEDTVDVVYGSSAGTVIGSYFISRQLQWSGHEIYYDSLTTAGKEFIDTKGLLRAIGIGLLDPRLIVDYIKRPAFGKPVLNLKFLLNKNIQETKPLDWEKFTEMQKKQPLKVIASSLEKEQSIVMDMEKKDFETLEEMASCMHASCLLPGIAGPLMNRNKAPGKNGDNRKMVLGNNLDPSQYEPLCDSLLFEPMGFHSALKEGATDVIVLRTRPDGTDVTGKSSVPEKMILRRFFLRKNKLRNIYKYMRRHGHKQRYAEDVLTLNEAARDFRSDDDTSSPRMLTIAVPPGSPEVTRLETGREAIFDGIRRGFARAYDALVEDPAERGRGALVAKEYFPDEILDYDPVDIAAAGHHRESAFSTYLRSIGEDPSDWKSTPERQEDETSASADVARS
uniref:PNPLA domain-containing protein n=1 Tax=Grammatophora oceanica TaxID=210454 RepID=A0A7S1V8H5_9STRA|eukprot:CAMPEP_0194049652 /NCGR_PEP_ID=MMETSP0009_2-20130614/30812_1 /TAXON_ID=210454 /ORGANISM="Grammatophora oceanica, Strain CCMP 410" /LENGTH=594 /DNA_ID=CAMNT_0038695859 /DNA_START=32 /DNA_END=1816 /DNA_ORIENTATION=+